MWLTPSGKMASCWFDVAYAERLIVLWLNCFRWLAEGANGLGQVVVFAQQFVIDALCRFL